MNRWNTKWIKTSIIVIGIILAAFLIECFGFNWNSIFHANESVTFDLSQSGDNVTIENDEVLVQLDDDKIAEIELQKQNAKIIAELNNEEYVEVVDESLVEKDGVISKRVYQTNITLNINQEYYIKKFHISYPTVSDLGYGITLLNGEKENGESIYDSLNYRLGESYTNINRLADKLVVTLSTSEEFTGKDLVITISNPFYINYCRILFLIGGMLAIALVCLNHNIFKEHIEIAFIILSLVFGSFIIIFDGTNERSWDEQVHFESAYRASFGSTIQFTEAAIQMKGLTTPNYDTLEEKGLIAAYTQERNDYPNADLKYQQRFILYNVRAYLPQSIMLAIARILDLPFSWAFMLGKFGNLLFYTIVMAIAIRVAKIGKIYIATLGLLPTPLFLASVYAYDAVITCLVFLGFILWLNEILEKDKKMKWYTVLTMIVCFVAGSWSKPIYMAMMLLLCFLPKNKFDNRLKSVIFKAGVVVVAGLMLYTIVSPPIQASSGYEAIQTDLQYFGDKRVANTSFTGQMNYILKNPLVYTGILLRSLKNSAFDYLLGTSSWLLYAYLGRFPEIFAALSSLLILGTSLIQVGEDRKYVLATKWKILIGIMAFGMASLIWTGMYLTFTGVGETHINGVQGRYYIPFILPLMFLFKNNKINLKVSTEMFHKIVFSIIIFINLYGTYVFILKPLCF